MGPLNCDGGTTGPKRMHGFRPETASSLDIVPVLRGVIFEGAIFVGGLFLVSPRYCSPAVFEGSHFWLFSVSYSL